MKFIFTHASLLSSEFQWINQSCHFTAKIRFQNVQRCNFRRQFVIVSHFIMRKMKCWNNRTNHFRIAIILFLSLDDITDRTVKVKVSSLTSDIILSVGIHSHNAIMIMTLCEILYHVLCKLRRNKAFKVLWKQFIQLSSIACICSTQSFYV